MKNPCQCRLSHGLSDRVADDSNDAECGFTRKDEGSRNRRNKNDLELSHHLWRAGWDLNLIISGDIIRKPHSLLQRIAYCVSLISVPWHS